LQWTPPIEKNDNIYYITVFTYFLKWKHNKLIMNNISITEKKDNMFKQKGKWIWT
jgi:hypothetical protein